MQTERRQRFTKIPVITRKHQGMIHALLRYQPDWKLDPDQPEAGSWYWPSVTRDNIVPTLSEVLDMLSTEFALDRTSPVWRAGPIWVHRFYQELVFGPTGELAEYNGEVLDLSALAQYMGEQSAFGLLDAPQSADPKIKYRWLNVNDIRNGRTSDGYSIAPAVWTILSHVCAEHLSMES